MGAEREEAGGGDLIGILVPGSVGRGTTSGADLDHDQYAAADRLAFRKRHEGLVVGSAQ